MRTNRIRLTESQLHKVIKESVKRVLREMNDKKEANEDEIDNEQDLLSCRLRPKFDLAKKVKGNKRVKFSDEEKKK